MDHLTALAEAAASVDHLAALAAEAAAGGDRGYASGQTPSIPMATVVSEHRRFLGLPMAAWGGITAGVVIASLAIVWVAMHNSAGTRNDAVAVLPTPPVGEATLAAEKEEPSVPAITHTAPPAAAVAPAASTVLPHAELNTHISTPPVSPAKASPKVAVQSTTAPDSVPLPPGVLHPWDVDAMRLIASGNDPKHPNKWATIQGKVLFAGRSASGKTFHLRFQVVSGPPVFEVVYSQGPTDIFKQLDDAYGGNAGPYLVGETVRVSGKVRVTDGVTVQMLPTTLDQMKIVDNPGDPPTVAAAAPQVVSKVVDSTPPTTPVTALPPKASPKVSSTGVAHSESKEMPPGVLTALDVDVLRTIADGKDPAHPDKRAIIQGLVVQAAPSASGKVFHIRFQETTGPAEFEVAYFDSTGMIEEMNAAFGGNVQVALLGKTIRVSGKLRVYNDATVQLVPDSPKSFVILDEP